MSVFSSILAELGFAQHDDAAAAAGGSVAPPVPDHPQTATQRRPAVAVTHLDGYASTAPPVLGDRDAITAAATNVTPPAVPDIVPMLATGPTPIDIAARLDALATQHAGPLDWRRSIADMLTLLGLDSSVAARHALARELGSPAGLADGPSLDAWLHAAVFTRLVEHGGLMPPELLH